MRSNIKTAIIIHGTCDREEYFSRDIPSPSNNHWFPWLQKELLLAGYETQTPEMPDAYYPNYQAWKKLMDQFPVNEESLLIGHSCGAGFLLRWLLEGNKKVKRVVLVAPWLDPDHEKDPEFFNFNLSELHKIKTDLQILNSANDTQSVLASVNKIRTALPGANVHEFKNYGHFCFSDLKTVEFLELRAICLS